MKYLFDLFVNFFKIGMFTFGGGYAMISLIEDTFVEKKGWISHEDMTNITVIAESTPGPVAINCATFVGYKQAGILGATVSTVAVVLPSFFILLLISTYLNSFLEIAIVANAFKGIKVGVGVLILNAGIRMFSKMKKSAFGWCLLLLAFFIMVALQIFGKNISVVILLLSAGFLGILWGNVRGLLKKGEVAK